MYVGTTVAAAALLLAALPKYNDQCTLDMARIDFALKNDPGVTAEVRDAVSTMRSMAKTLHEAGMHVRAQRRLDRAKQLLGIPEYE